MKEQLWTSQKLKCYLFKYIEICANDSLCILPHIWRKCWIKFIYSISHHDVSVFFLNQSVLHKLLCLRLGSTSNPHPILHLGTKGVCRMCSVSRRKCCLCIYLNIIPHIPMSCEVILISNPYAMECNVILFYWSLVWYHTKINDCEVDSLLLR